jgi:hypothetical protein
VRDSLRISGAGRTPSHGGVTDADVLRHIARAPVRRALRRRLQRRDDHALNLTVADLSRRTWSRFVMETFETFSLNRLRQRPTMPRLTRSSSAISTSFRPSAHRKTMSARNARAWAVFREDRPFKVYVPARQ